ncbi:MAG: DUF4838 domain-containing protein [Lentisphaerae bacterium]|nr:DUF4838 domain-containing protein [Lentisphaerota bacterium]
MHKIIYLLLLAGVLSARPVALVVSPSALRLQELLLKTVFNPQWDARKPAVESLPWSNTLADYEKYSAVIYLLGRGTDPKTRHLLSPRNDWGAALEYVRKGGCIIFLGDGCLWPAGAAMPEKFGELLGAEKVSTIDGEAKVLLSDEPLMAGVGAHPDVGKFMLHGPFSGLTGLHGAKACIGAEDAAVLAVNALDQGKVYFCNARLSASFTTFPQPYNQTANASLEQYFPFAKMLHSIILEEEPALLDEVRAVWEPVPLGPKRAAPLPPRERKLRPLASNRQRQDLAGPPLVLRSEGQARACIVVPAARSPLLAAARRLAKVGALIGGADWPVVVEKKLQIAQDSAETRLYKIGEQAFPAVISLGETQLAREAGLLPEQSLSEDEVQIACRGSVVSISAGNLSLAVETFLREYLGYRCLWPGESGEAYPTDTTIAIPQGTFSDRAGLRQRGIRNGLSSGVNIWKAPDGEEVKLNRTPAFLNGCNRMGLDPRETQEPLQGNADWWAVQRLGGRLPIAGGGNFYSWRERFPDRPEFFALQFDGTRTVHEADVRICKSNPEVIRQAAADILAEKQRREDLRYFAVSPSDGGSWDIFCFCPSCRAWDPQTDQLKTWRVFLGRNRPVFQYPGITDRVLRFTCEVARQVQAVAPDMTPMYLAYSIYAAPPWYYQDVPENFMVSYVGLQYFNDQALERDRATWDYWAGLAKELSLRPNLLLQGHGMPCVYVRKLDRDIKHCWQTGMISTDFDSLIHHWATSGLNYYVLAQLMWDPAQELEDIVQDYCRTGFGPGAADVRRYFALCEELTDRLAANKVEEISEQEDLSMESLSLTEKIPYYYTPPVLQAMAQALQDAAAKTEPESRARRRIDFLQTGLEFARREAEFLRLYYYEQAANRKELREYVQAHVEFLRSTYLREPFAVNMPAIAHHTWPMWRNCHLWK